MAISLTEAAKLSQDQLKRGVIETIIEESPLMQRLPFVTVSGNAYSYTREKSLGSASFRAVNSGYTASEGTFDKQSVSLSILGGDADVDRFIVRTNGGEVADVRASVTAMKAKSVRLAFHDAFINGTGASNEFEGLNTILASTDQEVDAGNEGLSILGSDSDDRQAFFDKVEELIATVDGTPSMLLMNRQVLAKFKSAARRESAYDESRNDFGRTIFSYQGIPLVDAGNDASGNAIITQTEDHGDDGEEPSGPTTSVTSSIYAVRFGADDGVAGLTNGGVQVDDLGELDEKPVFRTRIEFYCAVALHRDASAAVLRGVLAS